MLRDMKNFIRKSVTTILFTGSLTIGHTAFAQVTEERTVTSTTESTGTISEFGPEGIVIKSTTGGGPLRYGSEKTTTYVDEDGRAVSIKTVKSGQPVTVYYTKIGDRMVASRVVVKRVTSDSGSAVQTTTTTSAGTISEFGPKRFVIKTEGSPDPIRYSYGKKTTYVDEDGKVVSMESVKSGLPVTVYYTKVGDSLVATKVVVRKAVDVEPEVVEKKKTTTTTTTEEHAKDD